MDTTQLVAHGRARFDHASAKRLLKEKYQSKMIFAQHGGMWRAGPELQTVLAHCAGPRAVILDLYENPVEVPVNDLLRASQERWQEQMTAWLIEYDGLKNQR